MQWRIRNGCGDRKLIRDDVDTLQWIVRHVYYI